MDVDHRPELPPPRHGLHILLSDHHVRTEAKCRELMAWALADDSRELAARWADLEAELLDHMAAEEEAILPAYADHAPEHAKRILEGHARIRELLMPIGIAVELHFVRAERLRALVDALHAHAVFEDETMYPWAQDHLPEVARHLLIKRVGRWLRAA